MLEVRGPLVVNVTGLGFSHVASAPIGAAEQPSLLADVLASLPELPAVPHQKYRLFAPKNRQLGLAEQVPHSTCGQAEAIAQESGRQRRRPAQPVVKQPGGFGSSAAVRLETDRNPTHLAATSGDDVVKQGS
ncbi:hypothetical protein QAD02_008715 [Eretmocerus hayati]|uniref:Uncharacterized protein n=1 Tax=Eretmocerus hayati TaxID=131215 RepID=A0ACC2N8I3_9HYME|nr:hypothetical protein QAD02_008715 [Eretmocerus hayati]